MFEHCLYFNTAALARQLERHWAQAFHSFGLTPPQAFMLRAVLDRPGLLQSELAAALAIARPTATRSLDGLAAKGLIQRRALARDGRESAIHPTATAIALKSALNIASGAATARLKKSMGNDEFVAVVGKVRDVRALLD